MKPCTMMKTLRYLSRRGPSHFNEIVRAFDGEGYEGYKMSRLTIYRPLLEAEKRRFVKSTMIKSKLVDVGIEIYRWVRLYEITKKGRTYLDKS